MDELKIRAQSAPWYDGVELMVRSADTYGTQILMETKAAGERVEPTMRIDRNAAQALMDDLWGAGLRPSEGTGSAGALRAVELHLADMRRLVFSPQPVTKE